MDNNEEDVIDKICSLQKLFDEIPIESKRIVLQKSFKRNLDSFIFKMEEMYYKKIILNRSVKRLNHCHAREIENTFNTLHAFMPLMVAYSTMSTRPNPIGESNICQDDNEHHHCNEVVP